MQHGCREAHECHCLEHLPAGTAQSLDEMEWERGVWPLAMKNKHVALETRLAKHPRDVDAIDASGYTALHYAARNGALEAIRVLLAHGAAVGARTRAGRATALRVGVVRELVAAGARADEETRRRLREVDEEKDREAMAQLIDGCCL